VPNDISTIQSVPFTSPPTLSIDTVHISTTKLETNRTPRPCDNHRRMVKFKRGGNDKCYGLARWYRYASDNFYFPRSYFNDISLLQPGQALRHWMLNTAYSRQWHRWRSASFIKITMSLSPLSCQAVYDGGRAPPRRGWARGVFRWNMITQWYVFDTMASQSFRASSQTWGLMESPSWVLSRYLHFLSIF